MLTENDLIRYSRQILFSEFGEGGQEKLKNAHVVVAGAGGLGSPVAINLACAGIGHITIIDDDQVELSNLNRQILHGEGDIGDKKVESARRSLAQLNSTIQITPVFTRISEDNVDNLIKGSQVVIDAMDNFETRYILNGASIKGKIPFIHGGIWGLTGEITTIIPGETPCLACIYPEIPLMERPFPVFGVTPALIAALQAMEAIKLIANFGTLLKGKMLYADGNDMEINTIEVERNPQCRVCGEG